MLSSFAPKPKKSSQISLKKFLPKKFSKKNSPKFPQNFTKNVKNSSGFENTQFPTLHLRAKNSFMHVIAFVCFLLFRFGTFFSLLFLSVFDERKTFLKYTVFTTKFSLVPPPLYTLHAGVRLIWQGRCFLHLRSASYMLKGPKSRAQPNHSTQLVIT